MTKPLRCVLALTGLILLIPAVIGCSSSTGSGDKKADAASFKGGPMPPEARAKMQAAMQAAHDKAGQNHAPPQ